MLSGFSSFPSLAYNHEIFTFEFRAQFCFLGHHALLEHDQRLRFPQHFFIFLVFFAHELVSMGIFKKYGSDECIVRAWIKFRILKYFSAYSAFLDVGVCY